MKNYNNELTETALTYGRRVCEKYPSWVWSVMVDLFGKIKVNSMVDSDNKIIWKIVKEINLYGRENRDLLYRFKEFYRGQYDIEIIPFMALKDAISLYGEEYFDIVIFISYIIMGKYNYFNSYKYKEVLIKYLPLINTIIDNDIKDSNTLSNSVFNSTLIKFLAYIDDKLYYRNKTYSVDELKEIILLSIILHKDVYDYDISDIYHLIDIIKNSDSDISAVYDIIKYTDEVCAGYYVLWYLLFNRIPYGVGVNTKVDPSIYKDNKAKFKALIGFIKAHYGNSIKEGRVPDYYMLENIEYASRVIALFGRDADRVIKKYFNSDIGLGTNKYTHDLGVALGHIPNSEHLEDWVKLLKKMVLDPNIRGCGVLLGKTHMVTEIVEANNGEVPSSKKGLEITLHKIEYNMDDIEDEELLKHIINNKLSRKEAKLYVKFFDKNPKKAETLPYVKVEEGEYVLEKIDAYDKVAPFLGEYTDCCQHPGEAGEACAVDGWVSPESGFYIVKKGDMIIAQSWAWRKDDIIVMDSIEGFKPYTNIIAKLYKMAANAMIGKLMVKEVRVGNTEYGLASMVKKTLDGKKVKDHILPDHYRGYMDGKKQWLLAKA